MVLKDMHVRENLTMDSNHRNAVSANTTATATTTTTPAPATPTVARIASNIATNNNAEPVGGTALTARRRGGYMVSYGTLLLLAAFFLCTLLAVMLITYNFATCDPLPMPTAPGEELLCTTVRRKHPLIASAGNANDSSPKYERDVRLPRALQPLKYNISLVPHLQEGNFTFQGVVQIRLRALQDTYNVTLHAAELNISKSDVQVQRVVNNTVRLEPESDLRVRKQYQLEAKQFFIVELYDQLVKEQEYLLTIRFSGIIQNYLQGFYRSSYMVGNHTRWLASTQFQATDARRAFPCFDEPALKASFTLHIARPSNMSTVSNMPIVATQKHETLPDYVWDHFAESPVMSTYLVAYAITDFSHLSNGNFSVWARDDAIQSARYALSVGPKILAFLERFFDIKFPLPKMDMIALPDFQAGAMENWGLVTYRETTMLFEEGVSATTNKQRVASVVGHELAHMWFGNLVTPSWWTDIWLNEGFASYMEYLTVDAIEPSWRTLDQFVVNELQNVFQLDALSTSHRISVEVYNPDEITEIFDRISYGKGSTIIRMMNHFLTSAVFCRGLNKYLREMAYQSAKQDDLWRFLTNEATAVGLLNKSTTVKEIMDTWTLQTGYPVLSITRDPTSHVIRLEQKRFVFVNHTAIPSPANGTNDGDALDADPLWWIPITYTTNSELDFETTRPTTWVPRSRVYEIESRNLSTAAWFIFNIQQTGYYRVNYEQENWYAIIDHVMEGERYKQIAPPNRAQLLDDSMNLARGGYLPYEVPLNLSKYLRNEDDHVPWKAAISAFNFIDSMFVNQGDYDLLKNYLLKLLQNVYSSVGFEDEANSQDMLKLFKRVEILSMACHLGHRDCIAESVRNFQNWLQVPNPDSNNPISPNLRSIVYCSAIQYGTETEWDFAFERYLNSSVSTEKELLLSALGCSKEPWILSRYLRRAIVGGNIRKQDVYRIFAAVSSNVVGQHIAFEFVRRNWEEIKAYMGSSISNLYMILKFASRRMNSKFLLGELESFVRNELKDNGRSVKQIVEQVQVNVNWMDRNYKPIVKWLKYEASITADQPTQI